MNISFNFINDSNDTNPNGVVIFMKNDAAAFSGSAVAWVVFQSSAKGVANPFQVARVPTVAAADAYGNITPQLSAPYGSRFDMLSSATGNQLRLSAQPASAPEVVEVYNELPIGAISAMIYNSGRLLAQTTGIGPGQKATFVFEPTLYLSLAKGIQPGEIMDASIVTNPNAEISLIGIGSADIILTGGGSGADAQPYNFFLQNVKMV